MAQRVFTSELGRLTHETWTQTSVAALSTSPAWNRPSSRPREKETQSGLRGLEEEEAARSRFGAAEVHLQDPGGVEAPAEGTLGTGTPVPARPHEGAVALHSPPGGALRPRAPRWLLRGLLRGLVLGPRPRLLEPSPCAAPLPRGASGTDSWLRPTSYRPGARADGSESPPGPAPRAPSRPPSGPPRVSSAPARYHVPLNRGSAFCFQRRGAAATGHVERETSRRAREETNGHLKGQDRGQERDHETAERDTADTGRSSPGSPREFQRLGPSAPNRDSAENTHLRVRVRPCAACPHRAGPPATRFAPPPHCGPSFLAQ
ncbi:atrophin-1-like [Neofelis nebulosa]|uniref:atrophin-1-like n=1 Tax=Neofelis nebulosa TaxID=61452 RepID=UPI0027299E28|nr:atrophin-1-like [Neofelis nebulosa]